MGRRARDVLLAEVPTVLRADLYAVADLGGESGRGNVDADDPKRRE